MLPTYAIFDGDKDKYSYAFMKGWNVNNRIAFDFRDAHDIGSMTGTAQNEAYVKLELRKRMKASGQVGSTPCLEEVSHSGRPCKTPFA